MRETGIWDDRKNCDGLWALCSVVARNELIAGDFLFRNSTTNVNDETHVGLYLGRGMVIHAKGRDVGAWWKVLTREATANGISAVASSSYINRKEN